MNTNGVAETYASIAANDKTKPAAKTNRTYGKQIGKLDLNKKEQKKYDKMKKKK